MLLRQDNADRRLTPLAIELGICDSTRKQAFLSYESEVQRASQFIADTRYHGKPLEEWLRRPDITWDDIEQFSPELRAMDLSERCEQHTQIEAKYAGYIRRQEAEIAKLQKVDSVRIPDSFSFNGVPQLRHEAREKLGKLKPATVGQASRVSGITPADIAVLMMYLKAEPTGVASGDDS